MCPLNYKIENTYVYNSKSNGSRLRAYSYDGKGGMDWMYAPSNVRKQMEEEGHVYSIAYKENEPCGYVSVQQQEKDVFHLQKIYVLPRFQGTHCGSFLFKEAIKCIKEMHPEPCLMELNVNRNNKALQFYEHMGMRKLREGDFPIGNGYYMNDYIMGLDI